MGKRLWETVSNYYEWDSHNQSVIETKEISIEGLEKYTGRYLWTDRPSSNWITEVVIRDGKLNFEAPTHPINKLTPLSDSNFIDIETSLEIVFDLSDDNKVKGLIWHSYNFEKID